MSLNNEFRVKNNLNTLGQILSSGNDIIGIFSPYSLQTYVQQNSATWGSGGTVVQNTSANWNTAYNIATAYSSVSSTFATNSTVSALSGQFVLTTTLNTLTAATLPSIYAKLSAQPFTLVNATSSIKPSLGVNTASGNYASVLGGKCNTASACYSSVLDGKCNTASGCYSTITNGFSSRATSPYSFVGGGCQNTASGSYAVIVGGFVNKATGGGSTVSGGYLNCATGNCSVVVGGCGNTASNIYTSVLGGCGNKASGWYASILGGCGNTAGYDCSFIIGNGLSAIQANFTYVNNLSSAGIVTAGGGNSNQWNNVYTLVNTTTATTFNVNNITASGTGTFTNLSQSGGTLSLAPTTVGSINNVNIGGTTAGQGTFTNLVATSNLSVSGNAFINGSLYLGGSAIQLVQNTLIVQDPIIYLAENNPGDIYDIGFAGHIVGTNGYSHTGLLRGHPSTYNAAGSAVGTWYLFSSMATEPSGNSVAGNPKVIDTLVANVSGNLIGVATQAGTLSASRNFSLASGYDVSAPAISFNGSGDVALVTTIQPHVVSYGKIQTVAANSILGNNTGSPHDIIEIPANTVGYQVLSAATPAAVANAAGLGTTNSVTFADTTVSNGTTNSLTKTYYNSTATATLRIATFPYASYNCAKFVVYVNNTTLSRKAAYEILAVSDPNSSSSWTGTVYGIIDPSGMLSAGTASIGDFDYTGSTLNLNITLSAASNFSATVLAQAINA